VRLERRLADLPLRQRRRLPADGDLGELLGAPAQPEFVRSLLLRRELLLATAARGRGGCSNTRIPPRSPDGIASRSRSAAPPASTRPIWSSILEMRPPGTSKLFHAIVVAGAGLVGGCSRTLSERTDASFDRPAEASSDLGTSADRTLDLALSIDVAFQDATCSCQLDGGVTCCVCFCATREPVDGGACFPCYI
jgi:hypothetical protein